MISSLTAFVTSMNLTVSAISRSFGGFLRGQVVMAVLSGVVSAIAPDLPGCALRRHHRRPSWG